MKYLFLFISLLFMGEWCWGQVFFRFLPTPIRETDWSVAFPLRGDTLDLTGTSAHYLKLGDKVYKITQSLEEVILDSFPSVDIDIPPFIPHGVQSAYSHDLNGRYPHDSVKYTRSEGWFSDLYGGHHSVKNWRNEHRKAGQIPWYDTTWVQHGWRFFAKPSGYRGPMVTIYIFVPSVGSTYILGEKLVTITARYKLPSNKKIKQ